MQWWLGHSRPVMVLLIAAVASGCANISVVASRRPVLRTEPLTMQTGSDRLRVRSAQAPPSEVREPDRPTTEAPTRPPEPLDTQALPQPQQPVPPLDTPQPSRPDEPDPRAVIDWLLKDRR